MTSDAIDAIRTIRDARAAHTTFDEHDRTYRAGYLDGLTRALDIIETRAGK